VNLGRVSARFLAGAGAWLLGAGAATGGSLLAVSAPRPVTKNLNSAGGSVVAGCQPVGAYLVSWRPAQGYEASSEIPGPTATAKVTFAGSPKQVTMTISCSGGGPSTSNKVTHGAR
jgi:hypothetical protein